jgi:hypothetical protein
MPALLDPRWEKAAQARANGMEIGASYREAGFSGKPSSATVFFKRPQIIARVAEIQAERFANERKATEIATKKAGLDESWIIERVKYGIEIALRGEPELDKDGRPTGKYGKRQLKAAEGLLRLAADIKGMRIQRHEVGQPGDFARMSDEELDESLARQARDLGLADDAIEALLARRGPGETVQ